MLVMTGDEINKQAEWHDVWGSINRLNFWLQESNLAAYDDNHFKRKKAHDRFYKEIKAKLKKDEKEKVNKIKKDVERQMDNVQNPASRGKMISTNLLSLLDDYEDLIREFADKHDLLIPDKQDPGTAILR